MLHVGFLRRKSRAQEVKKGWLQRGTILAMPVKEGSGPPVLVLVGDDYYVGNTRNDKLGRMLDFYPDAV